MYTVKFYARRRVSLTRRVPTRRDENSEILRAILYLRLVPPPSFFRSSRPCALSLALLALLIVRKEYWIPKQPISVCAS